jgi:hypothetical protein
MRESTRHTHNLDREEPFDENRMWIEQDVEQDVEPGGDC